LSLCIYIFLWVTYNIVFHLHAFFYLQTLILECLLHCLPQSWVHQFY
jgi:hypothetical protein